MCVNNMNYVVIFHDPWDEHMFQLLALLVQLGSVNLPPAMMKYYC